MPETAPAPVISHEELSIATWLLLLPIVTVPVEPPVAMLTGKFDEAFKLTAAPVKVKPLLPVIKPVEVNAPAPVRLAPEAVRAVVPPGARIILPVELLPRVS